jgi:paraquat-inducible protein B
MTETTPPPPSPLPAAPIVRARKRLSPVWIIPIVAAVLGLWLVWQHYTSLGPLVEVRFETAEGIVAGKTPVQCRSVEVGMVESVRLAEDMKGVITMVRIDAEAKNLLKNDTRFWVVRPRFGGSGISGLGTLVSGTFIELDPGVSGAYARKFVGLENPPVTPQGVPGLHVTLVADTAGSLSPGSAVLYKGIRVGRIETRIFNPEKKRVEFGAFIEGSFGALVTRRTRFWNVSGIDLDLSSAGVRLQTGTLESLVSGGVAFDTDDTGVTPEPAEDGAVFPLYASEDVTEEVTLNPRLTYLLLFKDSVRGLNKDAPVEFRGIRVGTVIDISFDYLPDDAERRVPVLIKLDPSLIGDLPSDNESDGAELIAQSVKEGLRATLRTGSLLTGQLFVDLDIVQGAEPSVVTTVGGYHTIPTYTSGLGQLQDKLTAFLDKLQALPLDETVKTANGALAEIKDVAARLSSSSASLDTLLAAKETQQLPAELKSSLNSLQATLDGFNEKSAIYRDLATVIQELSSALRSIDSLASTLERKPSSLIWGNPKGTVSPPKAKR